MERSCRLLTLKAQRLKPTANIQHKTSVVNYFNNYFFTYFLQKPATFTDSQIHVFTGGGRVNREDREDRENRDEWDKWDKWEIPIKRSVTHLSHQAPRPHLYPHYPRLSC